MGEGREGKAKERTAEVEEGEEGGKCETLSVEGWPRYSCLTLADLSLLQQGNGDSAELTHRCHLELLQHELVTFVDLWQGKVRKCISVFILA